MQNNSSDCCLLKKVEEQELTAQQFGFYWEHIDQLLEQIQNECREIHEEWKKGDRSLLQEEVGDLLLATISLAIFCKLDPHETLQKSIQKFEIRYQKLVELAQADGHRSLHNQPLEILMNYWQRAKSGV